MSTMRAVQWIGPDALEVTDTEMPTVPEGWSLVEVEYTGLCGTDFSILKGTHPRAAAPLILGHEITGVVAHSNGDGLAEGTRVTVEPLIHCGHCHPCGHGNAHVCQNLGLYGIDRPGSMAEYVALPTAALVPVRSDVPATEVALAEPLAVAVHAVDRSGLRGGETVVVFGAGPIGILTALVARQEKAAEVLIVEPSVERAHLARTLGFTVVDAADTVAGIRSATAGVGADIVFDSAGHPAVAAMVTAAARVHGTIVIVGVYKKPTAVDLQAINFLEHTVIGSRVYTRGDVEQAVRLIETDALGLSRLPVQVFAMDQVTEAFDIAMSAGAILKVLVSPTAGNEGRN
ncbi:(R,R)-butanediol dehydrogenase/meso-butanediol dehydrogenase/diacetyl reductase [Rhodococcus sp. 27YEA15]|uniref:zinc-dependent alcohol dehydrogenase n=1 Tax=Rhodococcus sp. 27YEA15 TaxID=3156259 RepID=UPI003C7C29DE